MDLTLLLENTKQNGTGLVTENGLSILVEKDGKRILYDTGMGKDSMVRNARALGIDLSRVDAVVISHGHYDHTGGLLRLRNDNAEAPVYLKKEAFEPHFAKISFFTKNVGADPEIAAEYAGRLKYVDKTTEIAPGFYVVPTIKKTFPVPASNRLLLTREGNDLVPDPFRHELFMAVRDKGKLAIFCGCGHSGVKNIVSTARELFPGTKIGLVIGGFHFQAGNLPMGRAGKEEIQETARWLIAEGVEKVYTGHCTGTYGFNLLKPVLKDRLERIYTGMKIRV